MEEVCEDGEALDYPRPISIDLSGTGIRSVEAIRDVRLPELVELDLSNTEVGSLKRVFGRCESLSLLNIEDIPELGMEEGFHEQGLSGLIECQWRTVTRKKQALVGIFQAWESSGFMRLYERGKLI